MLGAFPGGMLGCMLKRCLSDAIFKYRIQEEENTHAFFYFNEPAREKNP